jgi:hypothetical protein
VANKSNASIVMARQEASFKKGQYKGLDLRTLPIRPEGLGILSKPSRMGGVLREYKSVFSQVNINGERDDVESDGSRQYIQIHPRR